MAKPGPYTRLDTSEVGDPSQRPTNWDYDRYLWLVEQLRKYRYDDAQIYRQYPFLIKDVFFSAVLVAANAALLDLADVAGASDGDRGAADPLARPRPRRGWRAASTPSPACALDYDVRAGEQIRLRTFAGFAPLFARTADAGQRAAQLRLLDSADFCGNPRLRWPPAAEHEPRRAGVRAAQLLARPGLAGHQLAAVAVAEPARLLRTARTRLRRDSLGQIAARRGVRRVLRPVHRQAARLAAAVLDGRRRAGLGGPAVLAQSSMREPMMTVLSRGELEVLGGVGGQPGGGDEQALAPPAHARACCPRRISMVDRK